MENVLVFKTTVSTRRKARQVKPLLDRLMGSGESWNFDLEDNDYILRVEALSLQPGVIIRSLMQSGFGCEELED